MQSVNIIYGTLKLVVQQNYGIGTVLHKWYFKQVRRFKDSYTGFAFVGSIELGKSRITRENTQFCYINDQGPLLCYISW